MKKIISVLLCLTLIFVAIPITTQAANEKYPYVLVHGLGGWGAESGINDLTTYWGGISGSISEHLNANGETVVEASVGPFSSTWDRACELYAQLMGTTVDYGEAHSKEHNHSRFGVTYKKAVDKWNEKNKVNLVGHSFGGTTIRMITSLLEYGSQAETEATGKDTSPLFTGNKGEWVHSVTTLCAPHNGTTFYNILDTFQFLIPTLLRVIGVFGISLSKANMDYIYKFYLEQFNRFSSFSDGVDNAGYDLSISGAAELNKEIKLVDNVYYFSCASDTTYKVGNNYIPNKETFALLIIPAFLMGTYTKIENSVAWRANDGLVPVISAKMPFSDAYTDYNDDIKDNLKPGIWIVMKTLTGHHGTIIGMDGNTEEIFAFYDNLTAMINSL